MQDTVANNQLDPQEILEQENTKEQLWDPATAEAENTGEELWLTEKVKDKDPEGDCTALIEDLPEGLPDMPAHVREVVRLAVTGEFPGLMTALEKLDRHHTAHGGGEDDVNEWVAAAVRELMKEAERAAESAKKPKKGLRMRSFEEVETKEPSWLWEYEGVGGIPVGGLTVFTGKGEVGKSTACRWLAAQVTHGTLPGHWHGTPRSVLYIAAEESNESMVKPSLIAHGVDMARVKWVETDGEANTLNPDDMAELVDLCLENDVALVIVDPMTNFMHGADMHKSSDVRERMRPWTRLAEEIDGSVVAIFHQNKSGSGDVVYGIGGSAAISEVSRSVFGFARNEDTKECVMSQEKNNLGQRMPSLSYRLESVNIPGWKKSVGKFELAGPSDYSAGEVQMMNRQLSSGEKETAKSWLKDYLRENQPAMKSLVLQSSGKYSQSAIEKAAKDLKVQKTTQNRAAVWSLP